MRTKLPFIKMHGLGNDFVLIDDLSSGVISPLTSDLARKICDRRFGIGADQILWLRKPQMLGAGAADVRMEILNADGSAAEMCGNGIRAAALHLYRSGKDRKRSYRVETLAGLLTVEVDDPLVSVDMGKPDLGGGFPDGESLIVASSAGQTEVRFYEVSMGNPHAVIFVPDVERFPVAELGSAIEVHQRFLRRTNVEFVQVMGPRALRVRVWERGAGITLACGTGACASAVAALATRRVQRPVDVQLPGGSLSIDWCGPGESVIMKGPAEEVFRGEFAL